MKDKLIEAHRCFMDVSVKGSDVEKMYKGLILLTEVINSLPNLEPTEQEEIPEVE